MLQRSFSAAPSERGDCQIRQCPENLLSRWRATTIGAFFWGFFGESVARDGCLKDRSNCSPSLDQGDESGRDLHFYGLDRPLSIKLITVEFRNAAAPRFLNGGFPTMQGSQGTDWTEPRTVPLTGT